MSVGDSLGRMNLRRGVIAGRCPTGWRWTSWDQPGWDLGQHGPSGGVTEPLGEPKWQPAGCLVLANNTGPCTHGDGGGAMSCLSPCYPTGALQYNSSKSCTNVLLAAINQAQASEHLKGLTLPSNFVPPQ